MKPDKAGANHRIHLRRETVLDLSNLRRVAAGAVTTPTQCVQPTTTVQPTHQIECITA